MPNPFLVLETLSLPESIGLVVDAAALAAWKGDRRVHTGDLAAVKLGGAEAALVTVPSEEAVLAVRRTPSPMVDEIMLAWSADEVPVAPLVETGLMGAMPDDDVTKVSLDVASGVIAVMAPAIASDVAHAGAWLVRVEPGRYVAYVARVDLPRAARVTAVVVSRRA